jgi:hypothetical protein
MSPHYSPEFLFERRRVPRHPVLYRFDVVDSSNSFVGYVMDIVSGGIRVRCVPEVVVEELTSLRIEFPRWLNLGTGLTVPGRFVWCKRVEGGGVEGGFAFDAIEAADQELLDAMIDRIVDASIEDRCA